MKRLIIQTKLKMLEKETEPFVYMLLICFIDYFIIK